MEDTGQRQNDSDVDGIYTSPGSGLLWCLLDQDAFSPRPLSCHFPQPRAFPTCTQRSGHGDPASLQPRLLAEQVAGAM